MNGLQETCDLVIVGAGLSTLSLLHSGIAERGRTLVLDYQEAPGGFLRHLRPAAGFEEAWHLLASVRLPAGVTFLPEATAVGLLPALTPHEAHTLVVRRRQGTTHIQARRLVLACGGLEAPREQAEIPGTRPAGVMTPILAHQLLTRGYLPGRRVLVYGASRYARVTAQRLEQAGLEVIRAASGADAGEQTALTGELIEVHGFPRLEGVSLRTAEGRLTLEVDTLVYATGMLANTHWLRGSGLALAADGRILVDGAYQTTLQGIYAIGTAVRPSLDHQYSIRMGKEVAALLLRSVS
jgi:thioredoxin reductase